MYLLFLFFIGVLVCCCVGEKYFKLKIESEVIELIGIGVYDSKGQRDLPEAIRCEVGKDSKGRIYTRVNGYKWVRNEIKQDLSD